MKQKFVIMAMKTTLVAICMFSGLRIYAQVTDEHYFGEIPVYKFRLDTVEYNCGEITKVYARGTEYSADLYSVKVGDNIYFKIKIGDEVYAVTSNPYGEKVSSVDYFYATISKNGNKVYTQPLIHKAGDYFLHLPYSNTNTEASSNTSSHASKKQIDWVLVGKVPVYSSINIKRGGREDYIVYDDDTMAFLYSFFDGNTTVYKISVPKNGQQYDVCKNAAYSGAQIKWDRRGNKVLYLPGLNEMYTHRGGAYYFNITDVRH